MLVVDADEIVTPELRWYLYQRIASPDCPEALEIPFMNRFMGAYDRYLTESHIRFFRKDRADWPPVVHSKPRIDGRIEKLPYNLPGVHIKHLDDAPLSVRFGKLNRYSDNEVPKRRGKRYSSLSLLFRPSWFFFKSYILKGGVLKGHRGIVKSYLDSVYQMMLLSKVEEERMAKDD